MAVRCVTCWVMQWKHSKKREQLCGVDLELPWVKQLAVWRSWSGDTNKHTRLPRSVTASKFPSNKPCTVKCFWTIPTCSYTRILLNITQRTILIIIVKLYRWVCMAALITGHFKMISVITNIYNKKTKGTTLVELFTATGKLKKVFFLCLEMFDVCRVTGGAHIEHL